MEKCRRLAPRRARGCHESYRGSYRETEAALGAAGAGDGAAALARPKSSGGVDAAAADDTAPTREANRMAEASASIIVPESTTELRNKLLSSTAWRFIG